MIEGYAGVAGGIDHEVEGQAKGFVEMECFVAGEVACSSSFRRVRPILSTRSNCFSSASMTLATRAAESIEFGICALHQVADGVDHLEEERLLLAEQAAMADAAAEDFAQDVAAAFVGGQDAVVDEEGGGAGVVGDDAQAGVGVRVSIPSGAKAPSYCSLSARLKSCPVTKPVNCCGLLDQRREQIRLEVGDLALQHGGYALEAHAGVDGGLGQRGELVGGCLVAGSTMAERSNCMKTRFQIST